MSKYNYKLLDINWNYEVEFIIIRKDIKLNLDDDSIFATLDVSDDNKSPRSLIPQLRFYFFSDLSEAIFLFPSINIQIHIA